MNRRLFLFATAAGALGLAPAALAAVPRFASRRISVKVYGTGPDVILIPGLSASRDMWNGTVKAVPGYRYHLVQLAGFAGHPAEGNARGALIAPIAAEIARYVAAEGLGAPAIIGHSMGGTIAMMIASRHPARIGRLMVVDMLPAPAGLLGSGAAEIRPLADSLRDLFTSSPGGRALLESLISGGERGGPRSDPDVVARASHELALLDLTPELPRIRAPMKVVYALPPDDGPNDPARISRNYKRAYAGARNARLVAVANSGHMIMYDQPAKFRAEVRAFLQP